MTSNKEPYKPSATPQSLTSEQEGLLLLQLTYEPTTQKGIQRMIRNLTMANVMLEAGLRVNELVQLRLEHLWYNKEPVNTIIVTTDIAKGAKERKIPVSERLSSMLKQMNDRVWSAHICTAPDFAFFWGDPTQQMTTRQIQRIIRTAGHAAMGLTITPHMLRHTFATRVLAKSNLKIVQSLLGHSSILTTQRYCHPNNQQITDAIKASSERD